MSREQFINDALATSSDDCIMWPFAVRQSSGYAAHSTRRSGVKRNWDAHRYVCEQAHGPAPENGQAAHRCGKKLCINPRHLYWAFPAENMQDAVEHGVLKGGGRYRQRIFAAQRAEIAASTESLAAIAEKYNIPRTYAGFLRRQPLQFDL